MPESERRTMQNWAARLSMPDEPLTREDAQLLAAIAAADRALETRDLLTDIRGRLARIELWMAETVPGYEAGHKRRLAALNGGQQ